MRYAKSFRVDADQSLDIYTRVKDVIFGLEETGAPEASYSAFRGMMESDTVIIVIADNPEDHVIKEVEEIIGGEGMDMPPDLIRQLEAKRTAKKFQAWLTGKRNLEHSEPAGERIMYSD